MHGDGFCVRSLAVSPLLQALILHIIEQGMLCANTPTQARLADLLIDLLSVARAQDLWLPLPRDKRALRLADHLQRCPDDRADVATAVDSIARAHLSQRSSASLA